MIMISSTLYLHRQVEFQWACNPRQEQLIQQKIQKIEADDPEALNPIDMCELVNILNYLTNHVSSFHPSLNEENLEEKATWSRIFLIMLTLNHIAQRHDMFDSIECVEAFSKAFKQLIRQGFSIQKPLFLNDITPLFLASIYDCQEIIQALKLNHFSFSNKKISGEDFYLGDVGQQAYPFSNNRIYDVVRGIRTSRQMDPSLIDVLLSKEKKMPLKDAHHFRHLILKELIFTTSVSISDDICMASWINVAVKITRCLETMNVINHVTGLAATMLCTGNLDFCKKNITKLEVEGSWPPVLCFRLKTINSFAQKLLLSKEEMDWEQNTAKFCVVHYKFLDSLMESATLT